MKHLLLLIIALCVNDNQLIAKQNDSISYVKVFDSIDKEIQHSIKKKDVPNTILLINRKCSHLFQQGLYAQELILLDSAIQLSNNGKDSSKYPEIKELYMESLNLKGGLYSYISNYEESIKCYISMDKYNVDNNIRYKAKFNNGMGVNFSMSGKYKEAIPYYLQTLYYSTLMQDKSEQQKNAFASTANLAGVFLALNNNDSAQLYIMEAQKLAINMKDKAKELNCLQLLGTLNGKLNKNKLAISYYNEAYDLAMEIGNYFTIPSLKLNISEIYTKEKNYKAALQSANEALKVAEKSEMKKLEMHALKAISKLHKQLGNIEKALYFLEESEKIRESLFSQDNEERFQRQKTDFDIYKYSSEKQILDKNFKIKEGERIIHNLIISFIILLLALSLIYLTYKLVKQEREKKALNEKHHLDIDNYMYQQKSFETEIEQKDRELFRFNLSSAKNSELIALLMQKMKILKTNNVSTKGQLLIKEAEDVIMELKKDSNIVDLNECLKHIPDEFYDKLEVLYPELSMSERKTCALMSFGLSNKDIANMTGKSNGAIGNIKFRIRQKMNVDAGVDLEDFMFQIRESLSH